MKIASRLYCIRHGILCGLSVSVTFFGCAANQTANISQGQSEMQSQNHVAALESFREVRKREPRNLVALLGESAALGEIGHLKEALKVLDDALILSPNNVTVFYNQGILNMQLGRFRAAESCFSSAIAINPEWADLFWSRGTAYDELAEWDKAISDYNEALHLNPHNANVYNNRAKTRLSMQDYDGAMADIEEALRLDPVHPKASGIKKEIEELSETSSRGRR